jgi:hypothetical protein
MYPKIMQYSSQLEKTLRYMFWATVLIPLECLFFFYSFVLRARFSLGRWPYPYHPDPKDLGFDFHHLFIWYSSLVVFFSPLLFVYMSLMTFKVIKMNKKGYAVACSIFIFFFAASFLLLKHDPGKFVEWFLD